MKQILIGIYGEIYDITRYINKHPGEGIKFVNLKNYNKKEASDDFDRQHMTNEADEILLSARKNGYDEDSQIYYVCPYFFHKKIKKIVKIPIYFIFLKDDPYAINYMKEKPNNTFILRRSNSNIKTSLSITYKNDNGELNQLKIRRLEDNTWYTLWENEEGEVVDVYAEYIEDIVEKVMFDNDYTVA